MNRLFLGLLSLFLFPEVAVSQTLSVDVKIVVAVDASGSVNPDELKLQISGVANAFLDHSVQQAAVSGFNRAILASVLVWSDAAYPKYTTEWHKLDSAQSFLDFSKEIKMFNISAPGVPSIGGGGTNIGDALMYAMEMISQNPTASVRSIIDVSGDGPESKPWVKNAVELPQARRVAQFRGITINGLAIETDVADLHRYYQRELIAGPGAFVERAKDFDDFQRAIIKKLIRELSSTPFASLQGAPDRKIVKMQ